MKKLKLFPSIFLILLISSIAFGIVYTFSYVQASLSRIEAKPSSTISFEGITLTFSSIKPSYAIGEKAIFYIDVLNLRDQPINRIDFSLNVKALSFFSIQVMKVKDYSTRAFNPGKLERITVERSLPTAIPPGFFALELIAKPASIAQLPPVTIIVYIEPSMNILIASLAISIFLGIAFCFSIFIAYKGIEALKNPMARKLGIIMLLIDAKMYETIYAFSIGQKFVFMGICILIASAFTLSIGLEQIADQLAILTYFALLIGVANLILENLEIKRLPKLK